MTYGVLKCSFGEKNRPLCSNLKKIFKRIDAVSKHFIFSEGSKSGDIFSSFSKIKIQTLV